MTNYRHFNTLPSDSFLKITKRIAKEYSELFSESELQELYLQTRSVRERITTFQDVSRRWGLTEEQIDGMTSEFLKKDYFIPAGTKGKVRGDLFNLKVKHHLLCLPLPMHLDVFFEKTPADVDVNERPDWYIRDQNTGKILIGMNQMDLWSGGHQTNRASKYIKEQRNTESVKLLCVVYNKPKLKNEDNKMFHLLEIGFRENRLCYVGGLYRQITHFFEINNTLNC